MPIYRTLICLAAFTSAVSVLAGCAPGDRAWQESSSHTVFGAQSSPKGYTYQDDTPLSSPAPSSPWIASAVSHDTERMTTNAVAWKGAVFELVGRLEKTLPQNGAPIRVMPEEKWLAGTSAHTTSFDHYLRQALIQKGYNLTTQPDAGALVMYKMTKDAAKKDTYVLTAMSQSTSQAASRAVKAGTPVSVPVSVVAILPYEEQ